MGVGNKTVALRFRGEARRHFMKWRCDKTLRCVCDSVCLCVRWWLHNEKIAKTFERSACDCLCWCDSCNLLCAQSRSQEKESTVWLELECIWGKPGGNNAERYCFFLQKISRAAYFSGYFDTNANGAACARAGHLYTCSWFGDKYGKLQNQ